MRCLKPVTAASPAADCEPVVTHSKPIESVNMSIQSDFKPIDKCLEVKNEPAVEQ